MARVTITLTDGPPDGAREGLDVVLEADPDMPLTPENAPDLEAMTPAQVAAYGLVMGLVGQVGAAQMFVQERGSDVLTRFSTEGL